jgi:beta-alanine degradation protein BauB
MTLRVLILGLTAGLCLANAGFSQTMHEGASVSLPASAITFQHSGIVTDVGELMAGPAYGDLSSGHHGTFITAPAGFVSPVHTHTEDYFGVVLRGVVANGAPESADVALAQGSYWFQRGEEAHVTKCLPGEDCLMFIYQPGAFDYLTVK